MLAASEEAGDVALMSSFGAESVVLLHIAAVIFIDIEMLFAETLVYQADASERLGLTNVRIIHADTA